MVLGFPKEQDANELRVAVLPDTVSRYVAAGASVLVEKSLGVGVNVPDADYEAAGARIVDTPSLWKEADAVFRVGTPTSDEISKMKEDAVYLSFLNPFGDTSLIAAFAKARVRAFSMEMIPRTTRAQKMDALSSQASLAGYSAVIEAAYRVPKALPMMMTAAGTISPCRVFVIGVGVAGLQAIATAKRLGARVSAFDTRPVVEEQVKSLGARFVKIDLGETGQTEGGYARELTPEQLELQRTAMEKECLQSDIVITTAQVFGRPAPRIVAREVLEKMSPGSVVVDMAVGTGGNVEGSVPGDVVRVGGAIVVGNIHLPGATSESSSLVYANNLFNFFDEFWDSETKALKLDRSDDIVAAAQITGDGEVVNERLKEAAQ